jgi:diguanylate cyclase (GGDEF)-like protein
MPYPIDRGGALAPSPRVPAVITRIGRALGQLPQQTIAVIAGLLLALVTWLDVATGPEAAFSIFYLVPIVLASWYLRWAHAVLFVLASGALWLLADQLAGAVYAQLGVAYWNTAVRTGVFLVVAFIVTALRNALQHERDLARTDALTGVANARYFFELARREQRRARRYRTPITIAYFDLDGFKQINDTRGHDAGDQVLTRVADALAQSVREIDVVARLGGDEFVILLPQADAEGARIVLDRMHTELARVREAGWPIAWSIGVATFATPPEDVEELVRAADRLMYSVKHAGGGVRFAAISAQSTEVPSPYAP